eukprot:COSAG05_NODE_344_length_11005_cov_35.313772_1_plen_39_part_10
MPNNQNVFIRPELEVYIQNTTEKMRFAMHGRARARAGPH